MDQQRFEVWEVTEERNVAEDTGDAGEDTPLVQRAKDAAARVPENPILMLLGGLAIGFVLGMILPRSRVERASQEPEAGDLKDRAREAIKDSIDAATETTRT